MCIRDRLCPIKIVYLFKIITCSCISNYLPFCCIFHIMVYPKISLFTPFPTFHTNLTVFDPYAQKQFKTSPLNFLTKPVLTSSLAVMQKICLNRKKYFMNSNSYFKIPIYMNELHKSYEQLYAKSKAMFESKICLNNETMNVSNW